VLARLPEWALAGLALGQWAGDRMTASTLARDVIAAIDHWRWLRGMLLSCAARKEAQPRDLAPTSRHWMLIKGQEDRRF
jgi:hypothetical protein